MTVTGVVFDLDGTLVDSSPDIAAALNVAFAELDVRELDAPEVLRMLGGGPRELVQKALGAVGLTVEEQQLDVLLQAYSVAYREHPADRTTFFADAADTLVTLAGLGIRLGICTNKRTDIAESVLDYLGVRDLFGAVVGSDKASRQKPDAAHLIEALAELDVAAEECLYVGDTDIDAQAAAAARVVYAHVTWGHPLSDVRIELNAFADLLPLVSNSLAPGPTQHDLERTRTPFPRIEGRNMYDNLSPQDAAKYAAGKAAVERYAHEGALLGLGSGTTSAWFVRALGEEVAEGLNVTGVPTSNFTRELAMSLDIPLVDLNELADQGRKLEVTIDGPDEIDHDGDMIKGGGACLLWERLVAEASEKMVCIADSSKLKDTLGAFPLPIEVIPYAWKATRNSIRALLVDLGYDADVRLVLRVREGEIVVTDSGNYIIDAHLGALRDKVLLDTNLNWIAGVVENGLFTGIAHEVIFANPGGEVEITDLSHRVVARVPEWRKTF